MLFVELHTKSCEVRLAAVPIGIELLFEYLASLDIEKAPASIEVLKDLDWLGVAVGSVDVLELRVVLLIKRVTHVHGDSA